MICKICNEYKQGYTLYAPDPNPGSKGSIPVLHICPDCLKNIVQDNYYIINLTKSVLPAKHRPDLDAFIDAIMQA